MKQKAKIYCGLLAILAFNLILAACPTDSGSVPDLILSGQVYIQNTDPTALLLPNSGNEKYNGDLNISDGGLGGTGQIKNGQLNYSIGIPLNLSPINEGGGLDYLKERYSSLQFSSEDVNVAVVALEITDSEEYSNLFKDLLDIKPNLIQLTITINIKTVNYIYVDKDLKITAEADTFEYNGLDFPITLETEKIDLSLNKGWNSLYSEITAKSPITMALLPSLTSPNPDLSNLDLSALRPKGNLKMSVDDPDNLNWTLVSSQSYDDIEPYYPGH